MTSGGFLSLQEIVHAKGPGNFSLNFTRGAISVEVRAVLTGEVMQQQKNNAKIEEAKNLERRIFASDDPYVGSTATQIEMKYPRKIVDVNKKVYRPNGKPLTDYDIELDNAVIQVKNGSGAGATRRALSTAISTSKEVIVYLPEQKMSAHVVRGLQREGFKVFNDLDEMLNYLGRK